MLSAPATWLRALRLLLAAAILLLGVPVAAQTTTTSTTSTTLNVNVPHSVVFAQAGFAVVANWSGSGLSIPSDLGGLLFSQNGAFLYVVGEVGEATSKIYRLNVVRNGFDEIVDLTGPAVAVFSGTGVGLDAGLAWGPGGNLFTT
jgi:hypothetical protein